MNFCLFSFFLIFKFLLFYLICKIKVLKVCFLSIKLDKFTQEDVTKGEEVQVNPSRKKNLFSFLLFQPLKTMKKPIPSFPSIIYMTWVPYLHYCIGLELHIHITTTCSVLDINRVLHHICPQTITRAIPNMLKQKINK